MLGTHTSKILSQSIRNISNVNLKLKIKLNLFTGSTVSKNTSWFQFHPTHEFKSNFKSRTTMFNYNNYSTNTRNYTKKNKPLSNGSNGFRFYHSSTSSSSSSSSSSTSSNEGDNIYSLFRRRWQDWLSRLYVLDCTPNTSILIIMAPTVLALLYNVISSWMEKPLPLVQKMREMSIQGLQDNMYTAPLTFLASSTATMNGVLTGLVELSTIAIYGSALIHRYGLSRLVALFLGGHAVFCIVSLLFNRLDLMRVAKLQEGVKVDNWFLHRSSSITWTPFQERILIAEQLGRKMNLNAEDKQEIETAKKKVYSMPDEEFYTFAKDYYMTKLAPAGGGIVAILLLTAMSFPTACIPFPYIPLPVMALVPFQLMVINNWNNRYDGMDRWIMGSAIALLSLTSRLAWKATPHDFMPEPVLRNMRIPEFLIQNHNRILGKQQPKIPTIIRYDKPKVDPPPGAPPPNIINPAPTPKVHLRDRKKKR